MVSVSKVGADTFLYEDHQVVWEQLPPNYSWREAAAVAVDVDDNVYVFNRGDHPMIVFDKKGKFMKSWGEGVFTRPHGVTVGPDKTLFCVDDGDHSVRQCTFDGKVLMTIGIPGQSSKYQCGDPFNRCTDVAVEPGTGNFYVSDGYGNSRVHKYSVDGKLLFSWGSPGTDPGEFNIVHNIATDKSGYVYVADRENHRVQVFDSNGRFETQWSNLHRPCAIYISDDQHVYVGELGAGMNVNRHMPNIGPRITVMDTSGKHLGRIGKGLGLGLGEFQAPHGIALDSKGNLYVAEVSWTHARNLGNSVDQVRSFRRLRKVD